MRGVHALAAVALVAACQKPPSARGPLPKAAPPVAPAIAASEKPRTSPPPTTSAASPVSSPPAAETDWGSPDPVLLAAADPGRRWLAICQARNDTDGDGQILVGIGEQGERTADRLDGYLVTAPGVGERIDAFVAHSPDGRHVVFLQDGRLQLLDVTSGARADLSALGADARDDQSFGRHRAAAFDPTGRRMLYLKQEGDASRIVVRTVATSEEHVMAVDGGLLWRAEFDATGERIIARIVTRDTSKNGRLDWPKPERREPSMRCRAPIPRAWVRENAGDQPDVGVARVDADHIAPSPHLVVQLDEAGVERHPDGTLLWRLSDGSTRLLAPDACDARLVHADPGRSLVLITCRDKKTHRHRLSLRGVGLRKDLDLFMVTAGVDGWLDEAPRLVPIHAGKDTAVLDMDRRTVTVLPAGARVIASSDAFVLAVRGDDLVLLDAKGAETDLQVDMDAFGRVLRAGPVVAALPWVVDLAKGALLGHFDQVPLAISVDGHGLFARAEAGSSRAPLGPLRWRAPAAPSRRAPRETRETKAGSRADGAAAK
jgi:hypothetical protein